MKLKHLDLFSGIGGFALAARWVGWETVGFCEIEPYCQKVLAKHWPGVPIYDDVKTLMADAKSQQRWDESENPANGTGWQSGSKSGSGCTYATDGKTTVGPVDIITGGFPCQDISTAGKGAGIEGTRSGLWVELARIIGEIRPRYAVLENVAALLGRGMERVAGDLAEIGYDAEWHCIPAAAVGAPHRRDRIWIIAYPNTGQRLGTTGQVQAGRDSTDGRLSNLANTDERGRQAGSREQPSTALSRSSHRDDPERCSGDVADADDERGNRRPAEQRQKIRFAESWQECSQWISEPNVGRVANGIPKRVDRLRGLGNAIVPQVAQVIFEAINGQDST